MITYEFESSGDTSDLQMESSQSKGGSNLHYAIFSKKGNCLCFEWLNANKNAVFMFASFFSQIAHAIGQFLANSPNSAYLAKASIIRFDNCYDCKLAGGKLAKYFLNFKTTVIVIWIRMCSAFYLSSAKFLRQKIYSLKGYNVIQPRKL